MPLSLSVVPVIIIVIITTIQTTYVIKGGGQKVPIKAFSYLPSDNSTAQCVDIQCGIPHHFQGYQADLVGWLSTRRAFSWGTIGSPVRMSLTPKTSSSKDTLKASQVAYRVSVHFRNHFLHQG